MQFIIQFPVEVRNSTDEEREGTFLVQFRVFAKSPKDAAYAFQNFLANACKIGQGKTKE